MANQIISREDARVQGLKKYFSGKSCRKGHVSYRSVNSAQCVACYLEKATEHRAKYPDCFKKYYAKNRDILRENRRKYHHQKYPRDGKMRKDAQERARKWTASNPERAKINAQRAVAKRRNGHVEGSYTVAEVRIIYKAQKGKCAYCSAKLGSKYHLDHIVALSKGGTNYARNIQITCPRCNLVKHAKDPVDFARSLGKLV